MFDHCTTVCSDCITNQLQCYQSTPVGGHPTDRGDRGATGTRPRRRFNTGQVDSVN